jgi:hypothetical protein
MPQNIFALVIEIHHAAGLSIPNDIPVIALCDFDSPQNWVSQGLVDYLTSKITERPHRDHQLEHTLIQICWSCERLGQYKQEGSFLVEPKAKFKIVFGCEQFKPCSPVVSTSRSFSMTAPSRFLRPRRSKTDPVVHNESTQRFRQGVENGTLLRLRRVPSIVLNQTLDETVEELQETLDLIYTTEILVNQALKSSDNQSTNVNANQLAVLVSTIPSMTIHSSGDSVTTESEFTNELSTNTSLSADAPQHKSVTRPSPLGHTELALNIFDTQSDPLSNWKNQSTSDDPWFCSQIPESKSEYSSASVSGSVTPRTDALEERAQRLYDDASIVADREASKYWTWDEEAYRYKHFDDGSDVPVWYSPPVT